MEQNDTQAKELLYLKELAMDLHWSWNHATDKIWKQLDSDLWEATHNPLVVLQTVSRNRISKVLEDPIVRDIIDEMIEAKKQRSVTPAWYQNSYSDADIKNIAFFSMEYMLTEALPIYSGGLGNVAGDLLKTASDLGVPVTGVGLLYQQGYSRQIIFKDGTQLHVAPYNDPEQLPVTPLRYPDGERIRIEIKFPGYSVWLRTWKIQVGRVLLLLLDSNDAANFPIHRGITNELYGGDAELRIMQEIILGIGGWRLLQALDIHPDVCHLNEGHTAFVTLERALNFMKDHNQSFEVAMQVTRSGNLFTTHTAVGAGFDLFPPSLIKKYLENYIAEELRISMHDFLRLGRKDAANESEPFNTSYLAVRASGNINGVSKLHGKISRQLFAKLFNRWPIAEVPVKHVTNGVHMPTWDSTEADKLWTEACGKERWHVSLKTMEKNIVNVPDVRLWELRKSGKEAFVSYIRNRYSRQLATIGESVESLKKVKKLFDPNALTLGFARRFVTYKRTNLLLHNKHRLAKILSDPEKPVQLVLAGKAHPNDLQGQELIKEWIHFISEFNLNQKVIFLSDYDIQITEHLVQGVDLWINTPRRPWEACGTSGMKVLVNGGLNISTLDGWWDEAYTAGAGWAIRDKKDLTEEHLVDNEDAVQLYELLENEIIPLFYNRNKDGTPQDWVQYIRKSMATLTPQFSSSRSLREYVANFYLPAAKTYKQRSADNGLLGEKIVSWKKEIQEKFSGIHFSTYESYTIENKHHFKTSVFLNGISIQEVNVELFAEGRNDEPVFKKQMEIIHEGEASDSTNFFTTAEAERPLYDFTTRITLINPLLSSPLENDFILWHH
jgi:glycogen phosphorylase